MDREIVKWQFVQELLFVFSACRSVKHDERASYGDMALKACASLL